MRKTIPRAFFDRPTLGVAKDLLGKYLVHSWYGKTIAVMITEVEAYNGPLDRASHAFRGRTPRTQWMFGEAGRFYIFFTYGMHWMANIVTGPKNYPAAILLRGGFYKDPKTGNEIYINGPARLAKFLHIDRKQNGKFAEKKTGLWFEDRDKHPTHLKKVYGKRIGVDYAGIHWANKPYNIRLIRQIDI